MKFNIQKRIWPEKAFYEDNDVVWWEKIPPGGPDQPLYKAELVNSCIEGIGASLNEALLDLFRWIEIDGTEIYVILTSRPDEHYIAGTEVFHYDEPRRITLTEYLDWLKYNQILCRGQRMCNSPIEAKNCRVEIGEIYDDGEQSSLDEFDVGFTTEATP